MTGRLADRYVVRRVVCMWTSPALLCHEYAVYNSLIEVEENMCALGFIYQTDMIIALQSILFEIRFV